MNEGEGPGSPGPSAPIQITPRLEEEDLLQLFGLAKSVFGSEPGWNDRKVLASLREGVVFVAKEHGHPAGYVALRPAKQVTTVEQLFVAPGHEQRGIGRLLLAFAEGYAISKRTAVLRVVVERDNDSARSFYRRSGFVPVEDEVFELVLPRP
ncbi:MAG TPA: GNAT family N-acetyltransferase [Gaiellaceae bacterium]|jgi:[ribosomal protein S18]-alanine N-acetyltransferase|nr:GNAT family N-acetyltransferase [Gaiellaceae bacterium]